LCLLGGAASLLTRAAQTWLVFSATRTADGAEALRNALGAAEGLPIQTFIGEHVLAVSIINLAAAALLFLIGIGLIRRRRWALSAGGVFIVLGFLRQGSALVVSLSRTPANVAGIGADTLRWFAPIEAGILILSLLWLGFVVWKFRQPSIRAEFMSGV